MSGVLRLRPVQGFPKELRQLSRVLREPLTTAAFQRRSTAPHDIPQQPAPLMRLKKGGKNKAVAKGDLPTKTCVVCQRPFTWRKKWEKCWDDVKYCSERCRRSKTSAQQSGEGSDQETESP